MFKDYKVRQLYGNQVSVITITISSIRNKTHKSSSFSILVRESFILFEMSIVLFVSSVNQKYTHKQQSRINVYVIT